MKQIRQNVFETNSSSTHSITLLQNGQFDDGGGKTILIQHLKEKLLKILGITWSFLNGYSLKGLLDVSFLILLNFKISLQPYRIIAEQPHSMVLYVAIERRMRVVH